MKGTLEAIAGIFVLFAAGALISMLGAMTGLGGGFLAVPFLVLAWRLDRPEAVLVSLTMILANSTSSSITYLRRKMVDLRLAALLALPTIPGLILGYILLQGMETASFDLAFSILLAVVMIYVLIRNRRKTSPETRKRIKGEHARTMSQKSAPPEENGRRPLLTVPLAFLAGTVSSAFGIGGGAILMPLQVGLLKVQVKKAIATSMFLIAIMTFIRVFIISGAGFDILTAVPMALGALLGAQMGAFIVKKVRGAILLYILSAFLFIIAFYMGTGALISLL